MARDFSSKNKHQMNNMCKFNSETEDGHPLGNKIKNVNITNGELGRIEEALKQEEFRNLLVEYAKEVQDPKAKEHYEADIIKLEAERGIKCTFLRPQPGHVVKARHIDANNEHSVGKNEKSDGLKNGGKVFINICWDPNVAKPESRQAVDGSTGKCGVRWSVPYCQSRPRQETDSKGVPCDVYDVIFHPEAGILAGKDPRMKDLLNTTAVDAIEKAFKVTLDRKNLKSPKLKYKGHFRPTVIREPSGCNKKSSTDSKPQDTIVDTLPELVQQHGTSANVADDVKEPQYTLKYKNTHLDLDPAPGNLLSSSDPCRPTELVVEIYLPEMNSAKGVDLDVLERQLTLSCMEPQPYHLELRLPYSVDEEAGAAKFDKSKRMLIVTLPVKPGQPQKPVVRVVSTDSGIGLDMDDKQSASDVISTVENPPDNRHNIQKDEQLMKGTTEKMLLPNYTCNIYENLMVFKLDVKNVDPDSLIKDAFVLNEGQEKGFSLTFENIGAGMVPMKYGFNMGFVFNQLDGNYGKENNSILEDMEVEVWDNNIIVQLALPKNCKNYKVGSCISDMTEHPLNHPLRTFKNKMDQLKVGLNDV
jgi:dynein assembly factor 2